MNKTKDKLLVSAILAGALSAIAAVTYYVTKKWEELSMLAESIDPPYLAESCYP